MTGVPSATHSADANKVTILCDCVADTIQPCSALVRGSAASFNRAAPKTKSGYPALLHKGGAPTMPAISPSPVKTVSCMLGQ